MCYGQNMGSDCVPDLKRTMALRHANSAGSTWMALNLLMISCSTRMSENGDTLLPGEVPAAAGGGGRWSGSEKSGQASIGIDHCMAHRRNNSLHDSSRRITCRITQSFVVEWSWHHQPFFWSPFTCNIGIGVCPVSTEIDSLCLLQFVSTVTLTPKIALTACFDSGKWLKELHLVHLPTPITFAVVPYTDERKKKVRKRWQ